MANYTLSTVETNIVSTVKQKCNLQIVYLFHQVVNITNSLIDLFIYLYIDENNLTRQ